MKRAFSGPLVLIAATLIFAVPLADAGSRDSVHWSVGVGFGSSPRWHVGYDDFHHPRHWSHRDHRSHRDWSRRHHWDIGYGHHYPSYGYGWRHDRWRHDPWISYRWSSPFYRHSDRWADRAVPRSTIVFVPVEPSPIERALKAYENPSSVQVDEPNPQTATEEQNAQSTPASPDGAELAGRGLAALARNDFSGAVDYLRRAFEEDPANAALAGENGRFRDTCNELKNTLIYRHPYMLSVADAQFLRAVLFLYTGDRPSAAYAARSIRDNVPSTARLQAATGSS